MQLAVNPTSMQTPALPVPTMTATPKTEILGKVDLEQSQLGATLAALDLMKGNGAYSRYNVDVDPRVPGEWTQVILANWSGNASDGESKEYEGSFQWTIEGLKVPYISKMVGQVFRPDHLKSVRIFRAKNAIIAAHKDYLEFKKGFRRLHIPLRTNQRCMNSEATFVYHMVVGGIYFLDGREAHAGGNLDNCESRVHLVLDFDPDVPITNLFVSPELHFTGGQLELVDRTTLSDADFECLVNGLAKVITPVNYGTVTALANLLPFTHRFDTARTYDVVVAAATKSGNRELATLASADRQHFLGAK